MDRYVQALVESALRHVEILDELNFGDIVISVKSSDVLETIESYRLLSQRTDYPLHIGVTESGTVKGDNKIQCRYWCPSGYGYR